MGIKLSELYKTDFGITKLIAMNQGWHEGAVFTMDRPRPTDAFLLFCGCDGLLKDFKSGKGTFFTSGSLVYIPHYATYSWTFINRTSEITTKLVEFMLTNSDSQPIEIDSDIAIIEQPYPGAYNRFFDELITESLKPVQPKALLKSIAYNLISTVSFNSIHTSLIGNDCIYKGIRYLEDDPVQDKTIKDIAAMCNVSVNYFERLFKDYSGFTPTQYRIKRKLERAKILLEGNYLRIDSIACELGFTDTAYFCKCFKKNTGFTPSGYRKSKLYSANR